MSIQDLITRYERVNNFSNKVSLEKVIKDLNELNESQKVAIYEYVAEWIDYCKLTGVSLTNSITINEVNFYNYANQSDLPKLKEFLSQEDNQEIFIRAWFNGYRNEYSENKYVVRISSITSCHNVLTFHTLNDTWLFWYYDPSNKNKQEHTRKELEENGFSWVFDCPGIEIEEVQE